MTVKALSKDYPAHVPSERVYDFDIFDPQGKGSEECSVDGYFGAFRELTSDEVPEIFWTRYNGGHWIPARGVHAHYILQHPEIFSSARGQVPDEDNVPGQFFRPVQLDPPQAQKYRALIAPTFAPASIAKLENVVRDYAIELIENLKPRGSCDFVADFSHMLPINIFLQLVDLPFEHRHQLVALVKKQVTRGEGTKKDHLTGILDYLKPIIAARKRSPGADLISELTQKTIDDRPLDDTELLGMSSLLLLGGLDTVVAQLGLFTHYLAEHPEQRRQLLDDPSLIPSAVEELLRRFPIASGFGRIVTEDFDYGGVHFKRGDHVMCPTAVFNLDHRQFQEPMQIDFKRSIRFNGAFGAGVHRCIGSYLARTELKIFLQEWLARIPEFRVESGAQVKLLAGANATLTRLPIEWSATARAH